MKKNYFFLFLSSLAFLPTILAQTTLTLYDHILFYDGYAATVSEPVPSGVTRISNSLYTKKITQTELDAIGNRLEMNILVNAACDNYDRIGNVTLAFVPKGATSYNPSEVAKIEIGRFITPFMNKNVPPNEVPYQFRIDNIAQLLQDPEMNALYDFWLEFSIFGVPYAAQTQVAGCAGRIDTFFGTLTFVTENDPTLSYGFDDFFLPIANYVSFNNYNATDTPGQAVKIFNFTLEEPVTNAQFYLITSKHGSNAGGEEYVRRYYQVKLNDQQISLFRPGGISCEPFRPYNTQANGIYGSTPQSESWWTSWNNWCPGDKIPTRVIPAGDLPAGNYTLWIKIMNAVFPEQQGDSPLTLYLHNRAIDYTLHNNTVQLWQDVSAFPNPTDSKLTFQVEEKIESIDVFALDGKKMMSVQNQNYIDIHHLQTGVYYAELQTEGVRKTIKVIKQ